MSDTVESPVHDDVVGSEDLPLDSGDSQVKDVMPSASDKNECSDEAERLQTDEVCSGSVENTADNQLSLSQTSEEDAVSELNAVSDEVVADKSSSCEIQDSRCDEDRTDVQMSMDEPQNNDNDNITSTPDNKQVSDGEGNAEVGKIPVQEEDDAARKEDHATTDKVLVTTSNTEKSETSQGHSTVNESLRCTAPDCHHLAHSRSGLIFHLGSHYKFEVTAENKSGETKFSYINGKYVCSLCPFVTFSRIVFVEHVRHHLLHHPYKCGHCGDGMESLSHLRQHNHNAHRQSLVRLVVNESPRINSLMSRLGPQAPSTNSKSLITDVSRNEHTVEHTAKNSNDPICIEDDGEDSPEVSTTSNNTPNVAKTERKEPLNQNFKYSLTKDGRLLCAQCKYMTHDVGSFASHVFNDIHHALKNPCGKCNQRGRQSTVMQDCAIVDQIMRALVRQKELQNVPREGQESAARESIKAIERKSIGDSQTLKASDEEHALPESGKNVTSKSSFEETMALLRTLSSDNQCDDMSPPCLKLAFSEELSSPDEKSQMEDKSLLKKPRVYEEDSGVVLSGSSQTESLCGEEAVISESETNSQSIEKIDKELRDDRKMNAIDLANSDDSDAVKIEHHHPVKISEDQTEIGCSRCKAYTSKKRKRMTIEEHDRQLKEKFDLEARPETGSATKYRCGIPGCMFTSSLDLNFKLHCMVKHPGMAALTCSLCQKGFENEDLLLDHINCEHNQGLGNPVEKGIYLCSIKDCGVSFNRVVELKVHFFTNHPHLGSFPCSFCFDVQPTVDGIMSHIQTHLVNVMKCSYCKKVFNEKDELLGHISSTHEGQPKKINICIKIVNNSRLKSVAESRSRDESNAGVGKTPHSDASILVEKKESNVQENLANNEEIKQNITYTNPENTGVVQNLENVKQEPTDDDDEAEDVELTAAKDSLPVKCGQCTFTCNTEVQMKVHVYECHAVQTTEGLLFVCKWCSMGTNIKETLRKHVAHHAGKNILRYYVCPYCTMQSNRMDLIEDHVMNDHSNEPFKFEVLQDVINYLQDMIVCPVCNGAFTWKEDFLHHLGSVHRLEDLVSFMEATFSDTPCLQSYKVPRHLFRDLLPVPVRSNSIIGKTDLVNVNPIVHPSADYDGKWIEGSTSERTGEFGKDGMILRFHCEICEFSINDYPKYKEHMANHNNTSKEDPSPESKRRRSFEENISFASSVDAYPAMVDPAMVEPPQKRMKFGCIYCPFECNKTLNYRRHMAIHERNKTMKYGFKCGYCQFLHERQNCIKFHLGKYHGHLPTKVSRIIDGQEIDVSSDNLKLKRPSRPLSIRSKAPADSSREKRSLKQISRWSASWETPYSFSGRSRKYLKDSRHFLSKPMDNIAADYMESDLPAGMIYPEPVKCPKCQFTNRVRINLVRHMKLHQNDGDIGMVDEITDETEMVNSSVLFDQAVNVEKPVAAETGEKDCIKIEFDELEFNAPSLTSLNNRNSSINESNRCSSTKSEISIFDNYIASSESDLDPGEGHSRLSRSGSVDADANGSGGRKLFKCRYCSVISKWNRRDISLHILHVHMQKRVYSCQYCSYGSSKSSAVVMNHCIKIHPQKKISVRDELALFNAIVPVQEESSVTIVGFLRPNGVAILSLPELRQHVGLSGVEPSPGEKQSSSSATRKRSKKKQQRVEEDRDQPLDLSVKVKSSVNPRQGGASKTAPAGNVQDLSGGGDGGVQFVEWKCKLCKFRNRSANHVKRHILCHHLKIKPFSCPYCGLYQWKAQAVISHIERTHPGQPKTPVSTASDKAPYLLRNMTRVFVRPGTAAETNDSLRASAPFKSSAHHSQLTGVCSTSFYRCKQCGFQEVRHDKTKYHVIKQHLKLGLFSCPYCRRYMWGRNYVARHIRSNHPGQEVKIQRTFDEYSDYLKENIKKIGGSTVESTRTRSVAAPAESSSQCAAVGGPKNLDLAASSYNKVQKSYSCCYCSFQNPLAAKIQSHCLARHPTRPVRYREGTSDVVDKVAAASQHIKVELMDEEEDDGVQLSGSPSNIVTKSVPGAKSRAPIEMYMCRYCHRLLWNMEEMMSHLYESHPDDPPEFELLQEPTSSVPGSDNVETNSQSTYGGQRSSDLPGGLIGKLDEFRHIENEDDDKSRDYEDDDDDENMRRSKPPSTKRTDQTSNDSDTIFKCRLCEYHTDKVTVMRHHVMSHLLYHPYRCPYCDQAHSVKSSPITKHIRLKHPGMEAQFSCIRDEEMERQVRSTYYRTIRDGTEPKVPVKTFRRPFTVPLTPKMQKLSRRAFYKCKFCDLLTHIRTDMKHHLMREMHYKPFICGYCDYTEPSRSGMGKHFRSKHCGMVIDIRTALIPEEDARVERMLEECVTRHNPDDANGTVMPDDNPRRIEPFKLLSKKTSTAKTSANRCCGKSFGSGSGRAYSGFGNVTGRTQKSKMPKLHHCTQCPYTSTTLRPLQAHMVKHRPARLQCGYCTHRSHYPSWVRKHIRSSHPGFPFKYCKAPSAPKQPSVAVVKQEAVSVVKAVSVSASLNSSPRLLDSTVSLPSSGSKTVAANSTQIKKTQKPPQGPPLLDGIEMDISLVPGNDGIYRCPQCEYQSGNRSHYKMHSVVHRPRKWKCFHCSHKFPLIFRLRRHSNAKHPHLPVKWVNILTQEVGDDSTRLHPSRSRHNSDAFSTARKSSQSQPRLTAKLLNSIKSKTSKHSRSSDEQTIDLDMRSYRSQIFTDVESDGGEPAELWFCCPKCPNKYVLLRLFVDHLRSAHSSLARFPVLEILPPIGEGELTLQRCGFCPYESFFKDDFDVHVAGHTSLRPHKCSHCQYASFVESDLESHCVDSHPNLPVSYGDLGQPYTMTSDASNIPDQRVLYNFNPTVKLVDVCKILQDKWDVV